MKPILITNTVNFTPVTLHVSAAVRYWEDAIVSGIPDSEGTAIPFGDGNIWAPTIHLETGIILGWPEGKTAEIHYKVCDGGQYFLQDSEGTRIKWRRDYVPADLLSIGENGYGDYIIMKIDGLGQIVGWNPPTIKADDWKLV